MLTACQVGRCTSLCLSVQKPEFNWGLPNPKRHLPLKVEGLIIQSLALLVAVTKHQSGLV